MLDGSKGLLYRSPSEAEITQAKERIARLASKREAEKADSAAPAVTTDGHHIDVVANVRNAEEAQEGFEEAQIGVSTRCLDGMAELLVSDCGPGFSPEIIARVFEPYVTTKVRGTGLGLAIVKKIVDEHQGTIRINNRQPTGAEVIIRLPLAMQYTPQPNSAETFNES